MHQKPRYNSYAFIHKALRLFMTDTLQLVGRTDWSDVADIDLALAQLRGLMDLCHSHVQHEDEFVHPLLEAGQPGSSLRTAAEHQHHAMAIKALLTDAQDIELAAAEARMQLGAALYYKLAGFIAENFAHMQMEETDNNAVAWAHFSDEDILAVERRLVASIPPQKMVGAMRWMLPSLNPGERALMLKGMKQNAPADAFNGVLAMLKPLIGNKDWNKLMQALDYPQPVSQEVAYQRELQQQEACAA